MKLAPQNDSKIRGFSKSTRYDAALLTALREKTTYIYYTTGSIIREALHSSHIHKRKE